MMTLQPGLYAALLTPFADDGARIDSDALGALVRHDIDQGLTGLYVGGSTGEAFLMTEAERMAALAAAAEAANGDCQLIAHVGDLNPEVSLRLARKAAQLGYDATSAVPPFYYGFSPAEIEAHYRRLAGATDLPFLVYNFPALTGVTLSAGQLAALMALPNVVGVKNTSPDYYALEALRRAAPDKLLFNGFDETLLPGLSLGADGGIGSTYNVQGQRVVALAEAVAQGDLDSARALQSQMNALIDVLGQFGVFRGLKFLLECQGFRMGPCRAPFAPLSAEGKSALERAAADLLPAPGARKLA